ncbi:MAG: hypothetical protein ACM3ZE_19650, partial [Myxococcales bacterium]
RILAANHSFQERTHYPFATTSTSAVTGSAHPCRKSFVPGTDALPVCHNKHDAQSPDPRILAANHTSEERTLC